MTEARRDTREVPSLVVGLTAAHLIGGLVAQMSPLVIGGLMEGLSLSERDAGLVTSVEFIALALTAIAIAPILPRLPCRRVGLAAVALTLLAQGASLLGESWLSFVISRGLSGVGEGALYAVSLCVVACRCKNPDRVYGYFQVVWAVGSVALFAAGGELTKAFAHRGILALMAGVTLILAPLLCFIPDAPAGGGETVTEAPRTSPLLGAAALAAILLYLTVSAAIYMFSAPLGERAGLDTRAVGYALTVTSLVGLAGAGAAAALHVRWGRTLPISGFCASLITVVLVLCLSPNAVAYVVALIASGVVYYFSIPYLFGLAAALDPNGRWAAAAGSAYLIGFAAGPVVGGVVITAFNYSGLAAVSVVATTCAWALALIVNRAVGDVLGRPQASAVIPREGVWGGATKRESRVVR
jgi:predicted MFS family arabinose efflux permease